MDTLQKEKDEVFEKLQRISADYANYQRRVPKQIADTVGYEKERIFKSLLPALDSFEHTLQSDCSAGDVETLLKGVQITYDQVLAILRSHGVEQIQGAGQSFDPCRHEAMLQRSEPDKADDLILEEFQKGYALNGRVIRPSKVIVNKLVAESVSQPEQAEPGAEGVQEEAAEAPSECDSE